MHVPALYHGREVFIVHALIGRHEGIADPCLVVFVDDSTFGWASLHSLQSRTEVG